MDTYARIPRSGREGEFASRLRRDNQRRTRLLRGARLKIAEASIEDINYKAARGLDKRQITQLATGEWIRRAQNLMTSRSA